MLFRSGAISEKIQRGKHTTRHAELIKINETSYIVDTPGFSSLAIEQYDSEQIKYYFPEFQSINHSCKFNSCTHIHEPGCKVKTLVLNGDISTNRYENYKQFYEECKNKRRY